MKILRNAALIAAGVFAAFAPAVYADKPEQPPAGMGKYYLFIKRAPPVHPGQKPKKIVEPDIEKLGGRVLESRDNYRVIFLPTAAVKHLRKDDNVDYLQRVWMGEDLETWESTEAALTGPRLTTMSDDAGPTWGPKAYSYDGSGNIRQIATDTYAYDAVSRLKQAVVGGKTETYQYDAFGNLTSKQVMGEPASTLTVDSASNRIANMTYDVAGNLKFDGKRTHWYDSMGMMSATSSGSFVRRMIYTADDERIGIKQDSTIGRWQFRDFQGRVIREFRTNRNLNGFQDAGWIWTEDWVYAGGQLVGGETAGPWGSSDASIAEDRRRRHYHLDHLGTVRLITTDARVSLGTHTYYPFGAEQTVYYQEEANFGGFGTIRPEPLRFTSHERDFYHGLWNIPNNEQLDYMHARYYDPNVGRFLSVDPVINAGAMKGPQMWNRYSYTANNPMNRADPDGRNWFQIDGKWEWHKGSTYTDGDGKKYKSNYTHLLIAQATGVSKNGATQFRFTLYNQNQVAMTGTGFSGGVGPRIAAGNYKIRTDIRDATGPNIVNPNSPDNNPPPFFGIQVIRPASLPNPITGVLYDVPAAYGPMRARLNPMDGQRDVGDYFHGQEPTAPNAGQTHGCLCYGQNPAIINYLWKLTPQQIPVAVDVPVTPP